MTKGKGGTKKPTPARAKAAKPAAKASPKSAPSSSRGAAKGPAAKAAPARTAPAKPARPAAPAPSKAPAKGAAPAKPAASGKGAPAKPAAGAKGRGQPGAAFAAPVAAAPKIEAPRKFQREYRKWLDRLISLRRQLVAEGERLGEEGLKALEQEVSVDHMADYGSDSYEQDTTLALIENKSEALRDVDEAIRRIEVRTYGLCEECEQLIPHGRLEVLPHARYCVRCQEAREGVAG